MMRILVLTFDVISKVTLRFQGACFASKSCEADVGGLRLYCLLWKSVIHDGALSRLRQGNIRDLRRRWRWLGTAGCVALSVMCRAVWQHSLHGYVEKGIRWQLLIPSAGGSGLYFMFTEKGVLQLCANMWYTRAWKLYRNHLGHLVDFPCARWWLSAKGVPKAPVHQSHVWY